MKKAAFVLTLAVALVCFAIMAVNSNPVLADDAVEQDILSRVKQIRRILNQKVLPAVTEAEVPKTGQTLCYDETGNGFDEIPCAGTGQDGDLQKGKPCPSPRFTDNADGTVTDNLTGLIWLKNANCFGSRTWADALTYCNNLADPQCGLSDSSSAGDWRLPNIRELHSLIDFANVNPALPTGQPFSNVQTSIYWSATSDVYGTTHAWLVGMDGGYAAGGHKSGNVYVWPVRGGQ